VAEVESVDFSKLSNILPLQKSKKVWTVWSLSLPQAIWTTTPTSPSPDDSASWIQCPSVGAVDDFPDQHTIFDVSNLDDYGEIAKNTNNVVSLLSKGNELWHADMQYHPRRDKYSILRAIEIPPKGVGERPSSQTLDSI